MKLSREEFDRLYAEDNLHIALVGMSNIGKSYTALRLSTRFEFELLQVDKLIWEELGQSSMADFATWQGQPYSDGYSDREAQSIALESKATGKAVKSMSGNGILDTTGSVIYTESSVQTELSKNWYVVHISASEEAVEGLKRQYFLNPKPLIWNNHFKQSSEQSTKEAILESYPNLLSSRAKAYAALADATISSDLVLDPDQTAETIFEALKPPR